MSLEWLKVVGEEGYVSCWSKVVVMSDFTWLTGKDLKIFKFMGYSEESERDSDNGHNSVKSDVGWCLFAEIADGQHQELFSGKITEAMKVKSGAGFLFR